eukprot:gene13694-biopygen7403
MRAQPSADSGVASVGNGQVVSPNCARKAVSGRLEDSRPAQRTREMHPEPKAMFPTNPTNPMYRINPIHPTHPTKQGNRGTGKSGRTGNWGNPTARTRESGIEKSRNRGIQSGSRLAWFGEIGNSRNLANPTGRIVPISPMRPIVRTNGKTRKAGQRGNPNGRSGRVARMDRIGRVSRISRGSPRVASGTSPTGADAAAGGGADAQQGHGQGPCGAGCAAGAAPRPPPAHPVGVQQHQPPRPRGARMAGGPIARRRSPRSLDAHKQYGCAQMVRTLRA